MNDYENDRLDRPEDEGPGSAGEASRDDATTQAPRGAEAQAPAGSRSAQGPQTPADGYYVPPRDPGPWQGGQYPGQPWNPAGGWQQGGWAPWQGQPYGSGWAGTQPGSRGYRPQQAAVDEGNWQAAPKKKHGILHKFLVLAGCLLAVCAVGLAGYGGYAIATGENPLADGIAGLPIPDAGPEAPGSGGNSVPDVSLNDKPFGASDSYDGSGDGSLSNTAIFNKVSPSVVGVISYLSDSVYGGENQGSGIIMSEDGYIITNSHLVEGAVRYEVVLTNGQSYRAELVGHDPRSDLAVLKVNETGLTYAEFGDSEQVEVGERVCVIGNPGGLQFQNSLTVGYVSALRRTINTGSYSIDCIQTDAAINPGNSGGPLINAYGQVIGISSAKIALTDYEGICFAIPISDAMPTIRQLISEGKVTGRAMLGITAQAVKATEAEYFGVPMGLWVVSVTPGADIAAQGVREGDIITHIDDFPVYTLDACSAVLQKYNPGDTVSVTVFRRENSTSDNTFKLDIVLQGS